MATEFRTGGPGFRSPTRPTERTRYCPTCGPVTVRGDDGAQIAYAQDTTRLCETCRDFIAHRRHTKPGFRQRYLETARRYGIKPS